MTVNQSAFEKAMQAALRGPEIKKLKFDKHEFNVKPVKLVRGTGGLKVTGQISHHLRFRDDDQVHYSFAVVPGQRVAIKDIDVDIDESILTKVFSLGLTLLKEYLEKELEDDMEDSGGSTQQALATAGDLTSARVFEESKPLLEDRTWQGEAQFMIVNIATRISLGVAAQQRTKVDPLLFARGINPTRPPRVRPGRPKAQVRDHRRTP